MEGPFLSRKKEGYIIEGRVCYPVLAGRFNIYLLEDVFTVFYILRETYIR